jgi:threonylcarbamoyladenosine tRNA methylthiotransferase MtaB
MKTVAFYTLGCKLNFSETSTISRKFVEKGYRKVDFTATPDIFIINTCSVTENADRKCRKVVREARKISPDAFIAIIGCYAQLKPAEIASIPGVDAVLGAAEKFRLLELLDGFERPPAPRVLASPVERANTFNASWSLHDRTRTFLKVQDGCDYSCSFCTIPLARGRSRSETIENVVSAARTVGDSGVKEIVLTGVNTGDFGIRDGHREDRFIDLIRALDKVDNVVRFRISSIEPNLLTDEVLDFVATSERFAPHFHVPLQSGSNKILRRMRRRYLRELYADRVQRIKAQIPHCCLGVDVIVGFPGESEADFLDTYHFINDLDVSYLHVFPYSERANTPAAVMTPVVPKAERARRSEMLHILSDKKRRKFYEDNVGREADALFETKDEDNSMTGFTENYIKVTARFDPLAINDIRRVKLTGISSDGFMEVSEVNDEILTPRH